MNVRGGLCEPCWWGKHRLCEGDCICGTHPPPPSVVLLSIAATAYEGLDDPDPRYRRGAARVMDHLLDRVSEARS